MRTNKVKERTEFPSDPKSRLDSCIDDLDDLADACMALSFQGLAQTISNIADRVVAIAEDL